MATPGLIKILIADDHPIVRQGLRLLLSTRPEFELVGEARNGHEAVQLVAQTLPHVLILDLVMPEMDGMQAITAIKRVAPATNILVLTSFTDDEKVLNAIQAGVAGCMIKDSSPDDLLEAIRIVAHGGHALHPLVAQRLAQGLRHPPQPSRPLADLTPREIEVLRYVGQGMTNQQIADELRISVRTVHAHIRSLLDKLDLANRTRLALFARDNRLV
jgi:NarL family two-component system response regulator LiaR